MSYDPLVYKALPSKVYGETPFLTLSCLELTLRAWSVSSATRGLFENSPIFNGELLMNCNLGEDVDTAINLCIAGKSRGGQLAGGWMDTEMFGKVGEMDNRMIGTIRKLAEGTMSYDWWMDGSYYSPHQE